MAAENRDATQWNSFVPINFFSIIVRIWCTKTGVFIDCSTKLIRSTLAKIEEEKQPFLARIHEKNARQNTFSF